MPTTPEPKGTAAEVAGTLADVHRHMTAWTDFTRRMDVLPELLPAVSTGRVELLDLVPPRPLSEIECKTVFDMIGILLETNQALQHHARLLAAVVGQAEQAAGGLHRKLIDLQDLAEFRDPPDEDESDVF